MKILLHGIHCNQSESTAPHCMESTAFNRDPLGHAAWNPLHSIGIHLTPLHGIHCINWDAFYHAAWNPLHSMTLHGIDCINRDAFYHAAWNPLHSLEIHWATLHGINCIQSSIRQFHLKPLSLSKAQCRRLQARGSRKG